MSDPFELEPEQRKRLLTAVVHVLSPAFEQQWPLRTFLALRQHEQLLTERPVLVVGERGVGKTAVFSFLRKLDADARARVFPAVPKTLAWIDGYSNQPDHPTPEVVHRWAQDASDSDLDVFWLAHLAATLSPRAVPPAPPSLLPALERWRHHRNDVASWVRLFATEMPACWNWLDAMERAAASAANLIVGYDDLDRVTITGDLRTAARVCGRLVALWVTLSARWRTIQGRVFLRPDLQAMSRSATTDASKLRQATLELTWSTEDLFRVLTFRLGVASSPEDLLRGWLERPPAAIRFRKHPVLGWIPPDALPAQELQFSLPFPEPRGSQQAVAERLVGQSMGTGTNKGYSRSWIVNHSRDALQRHLPRLTLNLVRNAAHLALETDVQASGPRLLLPSHLEAAQGPTGDQRREELLEQYGVVRRLEALRGVTVPLERPDVVALLASAPPDPHDPHGNDGEAALRELMRVGLLVERPAPRGSGGPERVDMPDLFRKGLDIRRKGGPLQLPRSA